MIRRKRAIAIKRGIAFVKSPGERTAKRKYSRSSKISVGLSVGSALRKGYFWASFFMEMWKNMNNDNKF